MAKIGILALQGAFAEHEAVLQQLGAETVQLRSLPDLDGIEGLVLPGGESTVQRKLLSELGMLKPLKTRIEEGLPVLATCAGLILLEEKLENDPAVCFGTLPVTVRRNAYGRQLGSFSETAPFSGIGNFRMTFIRAPQIVSSGAGVTVLAEAGGAPAAVRCGSQMALSFHPELGSDTRIHRLFLDLVKSA